MSKPRNGEGNSAQTWATEAKPWAADWSVWTEQEFEYRKQAALAQSRGKERDQKNEVTSKGETMYKEMWKLSPCGGKPAWTPENCCQIFLLLLI